jgi:uncharacterized membrane protein YczE
MKPRKNRIQKKAEKAAAKKVAAPEEIQDYPVSVYHAGVESLVFPTARVSLVGSQTNIPFQNGYYVQSDASGSGGFYVAPSAGYSVQTNSSHGYYAQPNAAQNGYYAQPNVSQNGYSVQTNSSQNGYYAQPNLSQNGYYAQPNSSQIGCHSPIPSPIFLKPQNDYISPLPRLAQTRLEETVKPPQKTHSLFEKSENSFISYIRHFYNEKNENSFISSALNKGGFNTPSKFHSHDGKGEDFFIPSARSSKENAFNSPLAPRKTTCADDCKYQIPLLEEVGIGGREYAPARISTLRTNAFHFPPSVKTETQRGYYSPIPTFSALNTNEFYSPIPRLANSTRKSQDGSIISTLQTNEFYSPIPRLANSTRKSQDGSTISTLQTNEFYSPIPRLANSNRKNQDGSTISTLQTNEFYSPIPRLANSTRKSQDGSMISTLQTNEFYSPIPRLANSTRKNQDGSIISTLQTNEFYSPLPRLARATATARTNSNANIKSDGSPIPPLSKIRSQSEFDSPIPPLSSVRADASPEDVVSARFAGGQRGLIRLPHKERLYYGPYVVEGDALPDEAPQETVKPVPKIFTLIKHKPVIYNELAIVFALFALAFGKTLILKADFGVTAVQSIPYLLSLYFGGISLGTWNLIVQGAYVLAAVILSQKIKLRYIFAIGITLVYVFLLDTFIDWSAGIVLSGMNDRIICFAVGYFLSALSITFFFKGNMPLMPYETLEKEIAAKRKTSVVWVKIVLDIAFFGFATGLSFLLFGEIRKEALGIGTLVIMLTMSFAAAGINFVLNIFFTFRNLFLKTKTQHEDLGGFMIYSDI